MLNVKQKTITFWSFCRATSTAMLGKHVGLSKVDRATFSIRKKFKHKLDTPPSTFLTHFGQQFNRLRFNFDHQMLTWRILVSATIQVGSGILNWRRCAQRYKSRDIAWRDVYQVRTDYNRLISHLESLTYLTERLSIWFRASG